MDGQIPSALKTSTNNCGKSLTWLSLVCCCSYALFELTFPNIGKTDRKSTRLNSSHVRISYAVFCLKKKNTVANLLPIKVGKDDEYPEQVHARSVVALRVHRIARALHHLGLGDAISGGRLGQHPTDL